MADPNSAQTPTQLAAKANSGEWFADAPVGAALSLDELFPNPELAAQQPAPAPATAPAVETTPPAAPTAPASDYFLEVETGTKYRTREEVIRGIAEKDRYIQELRQRAAELEAKTAPRQPEPTQQTTVESLYDAIAEAASKQDKRGYIQAQARLTESILAPYLPLMAEVAREKSIREAEEKTPGVREFMRSESYRQLTERFPLLKDAVAQLDGNPIAAQAQLGQLLELAKFAADGMRAPETIRAVAHAAPTPVQSQPPRPTLQSTTVTPAPASTAPQYRTTQEALSSPEGRKAIIEAYKQRHASGSDPTLGSLGI